MYGCDPGFVLKLILFMINIARAVDKECICLCGLLCGYTLETPDLNVLMYLI